MSGIAGILAADRQDLLAKMLEKIKHRGTTGAKIWQSPFGALGATGIAEVYEKPGPAESPGDYRAAILDGRLTNASQILTLVDSHQPNDYTDVDFILYAFEDLGSHLFDILDGEFALAIFNRHQIILARDRLGIRPLYYGFCDGSLCFASEIKALAEDVEEVFEFPPGHFLLSDKGMFPYQSYRPEEIQIDGALDSAEQLASLLAKSVERALPANGEIGVWLSGGVDSSAIAALGKNYVDVLHTFSAGVDGGPDLMYARQVAAHIGSVHHERKYTFDEMLAVLEKVIYHLETFDAPLVRSAIANYLVSELASEHVSFVLSGEGGDELFAGYSYQKNHKSDVELLLSVQTAIQALHNTALQRVDRSASAHSTGVGAPFLDPDVVRYALAIPAQWKIRGSNSIDKWPLRRGLEGMLPAGIVWRAKAKFWEGAGSANLLEEYAEEKISDEEFSAERSLSKDFQVRSKEELQYYRIFKQFFGESVPLTEIGRTQHI